MKKLVLTLTLVGLSAATMFGQGRVNFNNLAASQGTTVAAQNQGSASGAGAAGNFVGANYSVQLLWAPQQAPGFYTEATFLAAVVGSTPAAGFAFFDVTGASQANGAGFFDAGTVPNPIGTSMPGGNYTMMARAWYNNGTFATYDAAKAAAKNTGFAFFNLTATVPNAGVNGTPVPNFTVGVVPEPSSLALAGLGAVSMLLFRRKK